MSQLPVRVKLPGIPHASDKNQRDTVEALKQIIEVREGRTNNPLEKVVTVRDLFEAGLVRVRVGGNLFDPPKFTIPGPIVPIPKPPPSGEEIITPPPPTGLSASGAMATIILTWNPPPYEGHAYTEIWRANVNDKGQAVRIGMTPASVFADAVGNTGVTYYYWVRFVSVSNTPGPFNAVAGVSASTGFVLSPHLQDLSVTSQKIANGAIDLGGTKITGLLQNLNLATIADPTRIADGLINTQKIAALAVDASRLADSSVTATKIANAAVGTAAIQTAAITTALIANLAVGSAQIANAAITSAKIGAAAIGSAAIANLAVGTAHIQDSAITTAKIALLAVDAARIADAAIVTAKIGDLQVTSAKIADATITSAKIQTAAIQTAHIADANVTTLKLAGQAVTIPVQVFAGSRVTTPQFGSEISVLSATIVSSGAPIYIHFSCFTRSEINNSRAYFLLRVFRNGVLWRDLPRNFEVSNNAIQVPASNSTTPALWAPLSIVLADQPGIGTFTYDFRVTAVINPNLTDGAQLSVSNRSLLLLETKR